MDYVNSATFYERPIEFKALQFDSEESHETMAAWLRQMQFNEIRFIKEFGGLDGPYLTFEGHKVFVGQWVVVDMSDHSFEVLRDVDFKHQYQEKGSLVGPNFMSWLKDVELPSEEDLMKINEQYLEAQEGSDSDTNESAKEEELYEPKRYFTDAEAMQFTGGKENGIAICHWIGSNGGTAVWTERQLYHNSDTIAVASAGSTVHVRPSMWIIRMADGNFATCEDVVFLRNYQPYADKAVEPEMETCCRELNEPEEGDDTNEEARDSEMFAESRQFQGELASVLNKWSAEAITGTPDFVLANFLETVLGAWNIAVTDRAKWRGEEIRFNPGSKERKVRAALTKQGWCPENIEKLVVLLADAELL